MDIIQSYIASPTEKSNARLAVCALCIHNMPFIHVCTRCGCLISKKVNTKKKPCALWGTRLQ